jgi:hypothetical protein
MVDRLSLEVVGFAFGGITAVVFVIAAFVVSNHVGRIKAAQAAFDQTSAAPAVMPTPAVIPVSLSPQR